MRIKFIGKEIAQQIDDELMGEGGFTLCQLMELAGQGVAHSLSNEYPSQSHPHILILAGPGNNGGDGLVAARHLKLMGYDPLVVYPKQPSNQLFQNLIDQLSYSGITVLRTLEQLVNLKFDVCLDGLFGFNFKGLIREPFPLYIQFLNECEIPVVSIDIPSGWNVESGSNQEGLIKPQMLISLTVPKTGVKGFKGIHYLAGRFLTEKMMIKFNVGIPDYVGCDQFVKMTL